MTDFPLQFTDIAKQKLIDALLTEPAGTFIRVSVQGGGCEGFRQTLDFDMDFDPEEDIDILLNDNPQARIVADTFSTLYLQGTILDYVAESMKEGFSFQGGQAKKSCACGSSVSY